MSSEYRIGIWTCGRTLLYRKIILLSRAIEGVLFLNTQLIFKNFIRQRGPVLTILVLFDQLIMTFISLDIQHKFFSYEYSTWLSMLKHGCVILGLFQCIHFLSLYEVKNLLVMLGKQDFTCAKSTTITTSWLIVILSPSSLA